MAETYLTMVGQLQWLVTLGRFDLHAQVATKSRFRAAPGQGHMDRFKRIYSYAIRTKYYAIRFRTDHLDYSFLLDQILTRHTLNRILSKESKSFVSCSHMNCCLQKILHIN